MSTTDLLKRGKSVRPKNGTMKVKKAQRREEAEERQTEYNKLTLTQKLARSGLGTKERNKLLAKK